MILNQFGLKLKIKKGNFLCGCIYRRPNTDIPNFHDHIESLLKRLDKNKYNAFILGDFNIDLLQYECHSYTNDFINSVVSHSFLPYIHQPTRVTDLSATVIDNIFCDITDFDTLTSIIADHFAQFLFIYNQEMSYELQIM